MKTIIRILTGILTFCITLNASSQTSFIAKDSIYKTNVNLIPGTDYENARYVSMKKFPKGVYIVPIKNDTLYNSPGWVNITYFPEELDSYGFEDGRVYYSKEIEIDNSKKQVFLLRLVDGDIKLYYYFSESKDSYFFIQKQGRDELILLNNPKSQDKISYKDQLENYLTNCDIYQDVKRKVRYNRESLTRLFKLYNNCKQTYSSYPKYGISVGLVFSNYVPDVQFDQNLESGEYKKTCLAFGVNADFPINMSRLSFHPELYFIKTEFEHKENGYELKFSNLSANIPIMFRYISKESDVMPYINAGIIYSYNFNNKLDYLDSNEAVYEKGQVIDLITNSRLGIIGGAGIIIKTSDTSGIFVEVRYVGQGNVGGSTSKDQLKKRELGFYLGFNF